MTRAASVSWVAALAGLLFFLRFGYDFGAGDQEELFSLLLHRLDPSLFSRDWFVVEQGRQFTVRTPFLWGMQGLMLVLSLPAATLVVYVVAFVGVAWGLYRLAEALGAEPLAATASTLLTLVVVRTWTVGGNTIAGGMLAPEMVAWALALPAVRLASQKRLVWAGVVLGLAVYIQFLVGVLVAGALAFAILLGAVGGTPRDRWRHSLTLGGIALLVGLPMVLAMVHYRTAGVPPPDDGLSTFFLIAELRLPHHYLPSEFGRGRWARFGLLAVLGGAGLWHRRRGGHPLVFAERVLLSIALICTVAGGLIEGFESLFVAQLQTFKLSVLAGAVLVAVACMGVLDLAPGAWARWRGVAPKRSTAITGLIGLLLLSLLASGAVDSRIGPRARSGDALTRVEAWIAASTPPDALVAIPPSTSTFRLNARRSVVVTYKPTPFQDGAMHEWFARLQILAPRADPDRARGLAFGDELDDAYAKNEAADWDRVVQTYGITHVVRDQTQGEPPVGRLAFEAAPWAVYEIAPSPDRGEGDDA